MPTHPVSTHAVSSQTVPSHESTHRLGALPQPGQPVFVADGGLETWLVFLREIDLPDFAAFPLLDTEAGRQELADYYGHYVAIAEATGRGIVLDTATWRANPDWGNRLGYDRDRLAEINERSVDFIRAIGDETSVTSLLNGAIGPRGDGYVVGETMTSAEAVSYHSLQARAFADANADVVTAVTMTYSAEAVGVARAVLATGLPVVIGFTVETDGRLPSGEALGDAVRAVDGATNGEVAYYMVNCAHPSHFESTFDGSDWVGRVGAIRANASRMSHDELDEAEELDRGNPAELADDYRRLSNVLPGLRVVGGCCGTDHEHVAAIADALQG